MSDDNKTSETNEARESYILQISFWQPSGGPVRVLARDKEHARELLPKLIPGVRDIEIHDIMLEKDIVQSEQEKAVEDTPGPTDDEKVH